MYDTRSLHPCRKAKQYLSDVIGPRPSITIHRKDYRKMDMEAIIGFDALWESMMKCRRGVIWKDSAAGFCLDAVRQVSKLCDELHDGTYKERPRHCFAIKYPKEREIMSISFRDRVYQRSLNDVGIYPAMSRSFIYDNAACQKGKGADFARNRLKCHLQRYYRKHGADGYILKMDVRGYYPNMRHDVAKEVFRRKLDPEVYERAAEILDSFPGETGFNPGSQIIQIAGISVLDGVDHYIKERLRVRHYLRYMDDMLVIGRDRAELERIRQAVGQKLHAIGFELHTAKTRISPLRGGVMFLGFRYRLTDSGRVVMSIDPARVKAMRRKYRRLSNRAMAGHLTREQTDKSYQSWRNHAAHGNSHRLIGRADAYYNGLWGERHVCDRTKGYRAAAAGKRPAAHGA